MNMIAHFSIPSTGLDGVRPIAYHVAVHRWLVASHFLAPGSTIMLLTIGFQVALLPALLFVWSLTIAILVQTPISLLSLLSWAFGSLLVLGGFMWDSYLKSESYAFSLPVLFAMTPVAQNWVTTGGVINRSARFWTLILAVVTVIACIAAKISTGVILGIFLTSCLTLPKLLKTDRRFLFFYGSVSLLICSFFLGLAYFVILGAPPLKLSLFYFVRTNFSAAIMSSQVAVFCLWAFYAWGRPSLSDCLSHQVLTLALAVTYVASLVPGLLLEIGGGSAYFFSQPAILILLLFCLVSLINQSKACEIRAYLSRLWSRPWSKTTIRVLVIAWLVFTLLILSIRYPIHRFSSFLNQSANTLSLFNQTRPVSADISAASQGLGIGDQLKLLWFPPSINLTRLQTLSVLYRLKQNINSVGIIPENADTLVYLSPDFKEFWFEQGSQACWHKSFNIPAVLGLPLLNGVRGAINNCENSPDYGMGDYRATSWNVELNDESACAKAESLGFKKLLIVTEDSQRLLQCPYKSVVDLLGNKG